MRVGVYENPPKVFTAASGEPAGIFIDVINAVARRQGWHLRYVRGTWAEGLQRLSRGEIDLMPDVALTPARQRLMSFHKVPVLSSWDQIYVARDSRVRTILDLHHKRVAVLAGSVQQETFRDLTERYGLQVVPVPAPDYARAFRSVREGEAAAVVANNYYGAAHAREQGLVDTAILFNPCTLYFAAQGGTHADLLAAIDSELGALRADPQSAYHQSLRRWIGEQPTPYTVPLWLKALGLALGIILTMSVAGSAVLKRRVDARTRALTERNEEMARVNRALQDSEHKYRELIETANSIILYWTSDGRITLLNEYGQRFFGYAEEEVLGRHVVGTIVPEEESTGRDLRPLLDHVAADPGAFEHHVNENLRRNGERVWVAWTNKAAFDSEGRVTGVLSIGTDITQLRRVEENLRRLNAELEQIVAERTSDLAAAKERAESADRLKSAFLAAMSHELRTPLNSIIGFTGIILQGLPGPLNEEQARQMSMVQASARHLLDLINDILDLSKIEAGQLEVEAQPFEVPEAIDRAAKLVAPLADKKGLPLKVEIAPEVGRLTGDRRRFEQVLINLLTNALKFTAEGEVRLSCRRQESDLVCAVTDTGIGIKPESLGALFEPFVQLDSGLTRHHEGSGLGLSICRKLVEMMGGSMSVRSEWGRGSTFSFALPLTPGAGDDDGAPHPDH